MKNCMQYCAVNNNNIAFVGNKTDMPNPFREITIE